MVSIQLCQGFLYSRNPDIMLSQAGCGFSWRKLSAVTSNLLKHPWKWCYFEVCFDKLLYALVRVTTAYIEDRWRQLSTTQTAHQQRQHNTWQCWCWEFNTVTCGKVYLWNYYIIEMEMAAVPNLPNWWTLRRNMRWVKVMPVSLGSTLISLPA